MMPSDVRHLPIRSVRELKRKVLDYASGPMNRYLAAPKSIHVPNRNHRRTALRTIRATTTRSPKPSFLPARKPHTSRVTPHNIDRFIVHSTTILSHPALPRPPGRRTTDGSVANTRFNSPSARFTRTHTRGDSCRGAGVNHATDRSTAPRSNFVIESSNKTTPNPRNSGGAGSFCKPPVRGGPRGVPEFPARRSDDLTLWTLYALDFSTH